MPEVLPIPTTPGLVSAWVDVDLPIAEIENAGTLTRVTLRRTDYLATGQVTASVRNATGGGGDGIAVTLGDNVGIESATGSVTLTAASTLYLRVSAADASSMNLGGSVEVELVDLTSISLLASLALVKQHLGKTDTAHDTLLTSLAEGVTRAIQEACARDLFQTAYTGARVQVNPTHAIHVLSLPEAPVASVESISFEGVALTASDYAIARNGRGLWRLDSAGRRISWPGGEYEVDFTAGYDPIPSSLQMAAAEEVAQHWHRTQPGGGQPASIALEFPDQPSTRFSPMAFLESTREAIRPFVRKV